MEDSGTARKDCFPDSNPNETLWRPISVEINKLYTY